MWICILYSTDGARSIAMDYYTYLREASAPLLVPTKMGNAKASASGSEQQVRLSRFFYSLMSQSEPCGTVWNGQENFRHNLFAIVF